MADSPYVRRTSYLPNSKNVLYILLSSRAYSGYLQDMDELLKEAEIAHGHLCAGQVLSVRLAMLGPPAWPCLIRGEKIASAW